MRVASLDLCRALYVLAPDWTDTACSWFIDNVVPDGHLLGQPRTEPSVGLRGSRVRAIFSEVPAYDLNYLMRKLPDGYGIVRAKADWWVVFDLHSLLPEKTERALVPEDAAAMVCIKLWRQQAVQTSESYRLL